MALQELQQDPFNADEFVETLAWRALGGIRSNQENFDPMVLHASFTSTIDELEEMKRKVLEQVDQLEVECTEEEKAHWQRVAELHKHNQAAFNHFKALDERINFVATKVVHLGDQLEGVNTPRTRAAEAQELMKYFSEFLNDKKPSHLFSDPFQVEQAADVIQKLYITAHELPSGDRFDKAKEKIGEMYGKIEKQLIDDFKQSYYDGDKERMKRITGILSNFKGYGHCIDIFLEESQKGAYNRPDIFECIPPLCEKTNAIIVVVFSAPETVMAKFVLNVFHGKLQEYLERSLKDKSDLEKYLNTLQSLYVKTTSLCEHLSKYSLGSDALFLTKLTKNVFARYVETYIIDESRFLKEKSVLILQRFYESKGHQRKIIQTGGIHDLRRDLQAAIGTKTNLNLGPAIENYGGETFLSQETAINLLQEYKLAFKRCQLLSKRHEIDNDAARLFELLVQYLCLEHIDYAVDLGLQAIPLADPKSQPEIYFIEVVGQANTIFHLFEKQFTDFLVPLVSGTSKHSECLQRKREIMEAMENKLDIGLDRTLSAIVGWIKYLLTTEQKKSDFKPDSEEGPLQMFSTACGKVVQYIKNQVNDIHTGLDGKNVDVMLTELGIRFHRVVYEHLQQYQYNSIGAMLVICDVNEYRKCIKDFQIPLLTQLFNKLHALCNLLVVVPENLKQVSCAEELVGLDRSTLVQFVQLRVDYKTARLASQFR